MSERSSLSGELVDAFGRLEKVMHNVAQSAATNERDITSVADVLDVLTDGSHEAAGRMGEAQRGVGDMAQRMENLAAYVEEVNAQTSETAEAVGQAGAAVEDAQEGLQAIGSAVNDLAEHAREIQKISGVIAEIAAQTNLLALNAAIEAARAGDHGRGFAVLAEEIRRLADQAKQQTQSIGRDVDAVMRQLDVTQQTAEKAETQIGGMVGPMRESGKALASIRTVMQDAAAQVTETASLGDEQQKHIDFIAGLLSEFDGKFVEVDSQLGQIRENVKKTALSMEDGYYELDRFAYSGTVPMTVDAARRAAATAEDVMNAAVNAGHVSLAQLLDVGNYLPIEGDDIRRLARYFDVSRVAGRSGPLDPPKFRVPYEDTVELELCEQMEQSIRQHAGWTLFSLVDLNGYVVACADVDRPALTGDAKQDDKNRLKRPLGHPSWVRSGRVGLSESVHWLPNNQRRADFESRGASLHRPGGQDPPLIQTYIRNNVDVMTLVSVPVYVNDQRFGAICITWR